MTERDRKLLALIEEARAEMNARLDLLAAAVRGEAGERLKVPRMRRAPMRPPLGASVLITDEIVQAKARATLERMGLVKGRGRG